MGRGRTQHLVLQVQGGGARGRDGDEEEEEAILRWFFNSMTATVVFVLLFGWLERGEWNLESDSLVQGGWEVRSISLNETGQEVGLAKGVSTTHQRPRAKDYDWCRAESVRLCGNDRRNEDCNF